MAKLVAQAPMVLLEVLVVMLWAKMALWAGQAQVVLTAKQGQTDQRQRQVQRDWMPQRRARPASTALQARRVYQEGPEQMAKPVAPVWRLTRTFPTGQPLS